MSIKEWVLCSACFLYALFRGTGKKPADPHSAVMIQMAKLGDMVCTTPLFRAFKESYPKSRLTVIGAPLNKEILQGNTDVDAYFSFPGLLPALKALRRERFDFGCITAPSAPLLAALFLGGVRMISAPQVLHGSSPLNTLAYRLLLKLVYVAPHSMGSYAPREYLRLLEPLGIRAENTKKHLWYSLESEKKMQGIFAPWREAGKKLIGISPSAGNKVKEWPADRFAQLADILSREYGAAIIVFGGPRDREEVGAMLRQVSSETRLIDLSEKLSIDELKAAISQLDLFISADTGPIYIAEAFGISTVDIVGPMDEREQPPIGPRNLLVLPAMPRTPQLHILDAHPRDPQEAIRQARSIEVKEVVAASRQLLEKLS